MILKFIKAVRLKLIYVSAHKMGLRFMGGHFIAYKNLSTQSIVVDLGGNKGLFSHTIVSNFDATCFCVEANPTLADALPLNPGIRNINCAISDTDGEIEFLLSENDEASSTNEKIANAWSIKSKIKVKGCRFKTLINEFNIKKIDLLKIDIEGSEIILLNSLSDSEILSIPQITMEFHEFLDANLSTPTFRIIDRMKKLGYRIIVTSTEKFSEVLFLNPRQITFNWDQKLWYVIHQVVRHRKFPSF